MASKFAKWTNEQRFEATGQDAAFTFARKEKKKNAESGEKRETKEK